MKHMADVRRWWTDWCRTPMLRTRLEVNLEYKQRVEVGLWLS